MPGSHVNVCSSIHLTHRPDKGAVLEEFAESAGDRGYDCQLLAPADVVERLRAENPDGLHIGL